MPPILAPSGHDAAFRGNLRAIANTEMLSDTCLAANHDVVPYCGTSGDAYLRGDKAVLADVNIVTYLYQVVQLGSFANDGISPTPSVNRTVRSDPVAQRKGKNKLTQRQWIMLTSVGVRTRYAHRRG